MEINCASDDSENEESGNEDPDSGEEEIKKVITLNNQILTRKMRKLKIENSIT